MDRLQVREHRVHFQPGDEADGIQPVCADVRDGPQRPAVFGQHPPVKVGVVQQPVLQVRPADVQHVAEFAGLHPRPHLQHQRVEPHVVVHRRHDIPQRLRESNQLRRLGRSHGQRLLADDVLPGFQDALRLVEVVAVRRGDVNDIDGGIGEQFGELGVPTRDGHRLGRRAGLLRGRTEDADDAVP